MEFLLSRDVREQLIVTLKFFEDLTLTEIGQIIGIYESSVARILSNFEKAFIVKFGMPFSAAIEAERSEHWSSTWAPETKFEIEESRIITPESLTDRSVTLLSDARVLDKLIRDPNTLYQLTPRKFEEFVAAMLEKLGYTVTLSPLGRDFGIDVFAERQIEIGEELVLVQCKRYSPHRKVGYHIIKQLSADVDERSASRGLVVTTSSFTEPALRYIKEAKYRVSGADMLKMRRWLDHIRQGSIT